MKLPRNTVRHLAWVIAAKLSLLAMLYVLFFSHAHRPDVDADATGQHMYIPSR